MSGLESYAGSPPPSLYLALLVTSILKGISQLDLSSASFAASFGDLKVRPQIFLANDSENQNSTQCFRRILRWLLFQKENSVLV